MAMADSCLENQPFINNTNDGLPGRFLFKAVLEEKKSCRSIDRTACGLIKQCLRKSGVPFHSLGSLQLHSAVFHQVFISTEKCDCNNFNCETCSENADGFTRIDYFNFLLDKELGWFNYFKQMFSFMRMQLVTDVFQNFKEYFDTLKLEMGVEESVGLNQKVLLLTSILKLLFGIMLDLLWAKDSKSVKEKSLSANCAAAVKFSNIPPSFLELSQELSQVTVTVTNVLIELLHSNVQETIFENQSSMFKPLVEVLAVLVVITDPFSSSQEVKLNLSDLLCNEIVGNNDNCSNQNATNCSKDRKINEKFQQRLSENADYVSESGGGTSGHVENNVNSEEKSFHQLFNPVVLDVLKLFRNMLSLRTVSNMHHYFMRGSDKRHKPFYNNLTQVIDSKESIEIVRHCLKREALFSKMEEVLCKLNDKEKINEEILDITYRDKGFLKLIAEFEVYPNRKLFDVSPAQEFLAVQQQVVGQEDFELLKTATKEHMKGWYDLVSLGFENRNFEQWWNIGFYDFVMSRVSWLSNETNVRHILALLIELSSQNERCLQHIHKVTKLLKDMYSKLPPALQERVILYGPMISEPVHQQLPQEKSPLGGKGFETTSKADSEKDWLCLLLNTDDLEKEITQLLNKLTLNSYPQLLPQILFLCLYSREMVLNQMIQAAVNNKGQVRPVVELLRHVADLCKSSQGNHTLLMKCLMSVLTNNVLDERSTENAVVAIDLLTQRYQQGIDSNIKNYHRESVLNIEEVMEMIVIPVLNTQILMYNESVQDDDTDTEGNEMEKLDVNSSVLSVSFCLQILYCLLDSIELENLQVDCVVLLETLANLCLQHMTISVGNTTRIKDSIGEGKELNVYQQTKRCLDRLMTKLLDKNEIIDKNSLDFVLTESYQQGGLMSIALIYPLLEKNDRFNMETVLMALIDNAVHLGISTVVSTLMTLGQLNDAMCQVVLKTMESKAFAALEISRTQLIIMLAQMLIHTCVCDVPRLCPIMKHLIHQSIHSPNKTNEDYSLEHEVMSEDDNLISFINWNQVAKDCRLRCTCIGFMADSLTWLLTLDNQPSLSLIDTAMINYQTACHIFLEQKEIINSESGNRIPNELRPLCLSDQTALLIKTFVHCCGLLPLLEKMHPAVESATQSAFEMCCKQALHVLALSCLTNLSNTIKGEEQQQKESTSEKGKQNQTHWLENRDNVLFMRNITIACVNEPTISKQLVKQLEEIWCVILSTKNKSLTL